MTGRTTLISSILIGLAAIAALAVLPLGTFASVAAGITASVAIALGALAFMTRHWERASRDSIEQVIADGRQLTEQSTGDDTSVLAG